MCFSPLKMLARTALFALLLSGAFPGADVFAQRPNRDSVRLEVPRVSLSASPGSVSAGQPVRLFAQLSSNYPNIRFRFEFGDGTVSNWQSSGAITHTYRTPGRYLAFVDIGAATGAGVTRLGGSPRRPIQVTGAPLGPVELVISPANPQPGRPVTLSVRGGSNDPNVRYRFVFGDGSPVGGWQSGSQAVYVYRNSGTYSPYVEVGRFTDGGIRREKSAGRAIVLTFPTVKNQTLDRKGNTRKETSIQSPDTQAKALAKDQAKLPSPPPSKTSSAKPSPGRSLPALTPSPVPSASDDANDGAVASTAPTGDWRNYWWLVIPLALIALIAGRKLLAPRPSIRTVADPGAANVSEATGLAIDSQVVSRPNALDGEHSISSDEPNLVKRSENV